ncbi:MAG: hypothetical protein ACXVB4_14990 [Pseudobdellovibrionaceae bacterium]
MKKILLHLLMMSGVLTTASLCSAMSYFVTQTGAGNYSGTSLSNAWSAAIYNSSLVPQGGDTVFFSGTISSTLIPNTSGTGNATGRLVLDFSNATLSGGINIDAKNYPTLLGGSLSSSSSNLISCSARAAHDITISNFTFTGLSGNNGTQTFFTVGLCSNVLISNNITDNLGCFVGAWNGATHDIVIRNNFARTSTNSVEQTDLIFLGDTSNVTIEGNKLVHQAPGSQNNSRHNDIIQTFQGGGSSNQSPANWTIRYNWIEIAVPAGTDTDGSNSWTMLENMSGINKIYSNIFVGGGGAVATNGLDFNSCAPSVIVFLYNNTFVAHGTPVNTVRFQNTGTLYAENNIGVADGISGVTLQWDWTKAAVDRNYFYNFGNCDSSYTGLNGTCNTDPKFVDYANNNFALQSNSPLLAAGDSTIGSEYSKGISQNATWPNPTLSSRAVSGNWEAGAYVYGTSITPLLKPPMNLRIY